MTDKNNFLGNIEAEEAILGGILLDPTAISIVVDMLPIEAFYVQSHQQIYKTALELYQKDQPTDLMHVSTWLADHNLLEKVGGTTKLSQLLNRTVSAANIDRYATLVLNKYQRRQLVRVGHEIVELGYDTTTELETIFDTSEEKIFNLNTNKQDKFQPKPINECLANVFNKIEQGSSPAYPTGLTDLDSLIGGLIKQDLIVVSGRPSMGKSWVACYLANYIAQNENKPVVFFSAEMSEEQLTKRFLSMHTGIDSQRLTHNQIYEDEYDTLADCPESTVLSTFADSNYLRMCSRRFNRHYILGIFGCILIHKLVDISKLKALFHCRTVKSPLQWNRLVIKSFVFQSS